MAAGLSRLAASRQHVCRIVADLDLMTVGIEKVYLFDSGIGQLATAKLDAALVEQCDDRLQVVGVQGKMA